MPLSTHITELLAPLAEPLRAPAMHAYMRAQFAFLGIATPARRAALAPVLRAHQQLSHDDLMECVQTLWSLPEREYQYAALDLLSHFGDRLGSADIDALLELARQKAWWDTVDALASVVGRILRAARAADADCQQRVDRALRDPCLWVRRIAMLHQLGWRGDTDTARLFAYANALAPETDFFIRKAIGWALRDYARHDPAAVRAFLSEQGERLSGLSRREAAKHLA